jgi:salicylate hydroxylase
MDEDQASPRIAVVGGGIGGLAAGAFLRRAGLRATVYEQATALRAVGAGLVVAPNVVRLLRRLDSFSQFVARAVAIDIGWEFRRWENGEVLSAENLIEDCERRYGERTYTVHRADLLDVVKAAVAPESVRLGKRCVGVETDGDTAGLRFQDGSVEVADVVIGADGVHSLTREAVTTPAPPEYSGMCAFRAIVPTNRAPAFARRPAQTLWLGPGRHLVHYPISGGAAINIVAFAPAGNLTDESWSATASVAEFLAEFDGWDPRLQDLIRAGGIPGRWALLDRAPLQRWTRGPVTLLGDAAHPMFPFFAQGAGQAIEDAAVLAACLAATPTEPAHALRRYEELRIERATRVQQASRGRADINHLPDGPEQRARDAALAAADPLVANGWLYAYDAEAVAAEAMA